MQNQGQGPIMAGQIQRPRWGTLQPLRPGTLMHPPGPQPQPLMRPLMRPPGGLPGAGLPPNLAPGHGPNASSTLNRHIRPNQVWNRWQRHL